MSTTSNQDAHPHAELMMEYAKDAMTRPDPWLLWQWRGDEGKAWADLTDNPIWYRLYEYRRKPVPTRVINGFTVPRGETEPPQGEDVHYFAPDAGDSTWFRDYYWGNGTVDINRLNRGLVFLTEEHAVAVAKAMCGIDPEWSQD